MPLPPQPPNNIPLASSLPKVSFRKVPPHLIPPTVPSNLTAQNIAYGYNQGSPFIMPNHYLRYVEPIEADLKRHVEYDMDEQDQEWLEAVNAERRREQLDVISYEVFEIIIDRLEKEYFDLIKLVPVRAQPAGDGDNDGAEDTNCAICDDGECENSNAIVFCDGCNLAVHQDCYGIPYIPEGQWLCRKCTVSPDRAVACVLCPNEGGAFKQTTQGKWAHLLCAMWIPETGVSNAVFMEPVDSIERIPKARWKLQCYLCRKKAGACIQCDNKNCFTAFHVTCARRAGLLLKAIRQRATHKHDVGDDSDEEEEEELLRACCHKHLPAPMKAERARKAVEAAVLASDSQAPRKRGIKLTLSRNGNGASNFVAAAPAAMSKAARAYKRSYKPKPALVPAYVISRVMEHISRLHFRKKPAFVLQVARFWSLKREARRGASLLKRLHLEPWTASTSSKESTDASKAAKLQFIRQLREDLERVRMLTELMRKRERDKLRRAQSLKKVWIEEQFFPLLSKMRTALEKIMAIDRFSLFADPVSPTEVPDYHTIITHPMDWSTLSSHLESLTHYTTLDAFKADVVLVLDNAMKYNKPETGFYKTAAKIKAALPEIWDSVFGAGVGSQATPLANGSQHEVAPVDTDRKAEEEAEADAAAGALVSQWEAELRALDAEDLEPNDALLGLLAQPANGEAAATGWNIEELLELIALCKEPELGVDDGTLPPPTSSSGREPRSDARSDDPWPSSEAGTAIPPSTSLPMSTLDAWVDRWKIASRRMGQRERERRAEERDREKILRAEKTAREREERKARAARGEGRPRTSSGSGLLASDEPEVFANRTRSGQITPITSAAPKEQSSGSDPLSEPPTSAKSARGNPAPPLTEPESAPSAVRPSRTRTQTGDEHGPRSDEAAASAVQGRSSRRRSSASEAHSEPKGRTLRQVNPSTADTAAGASTSAANTIAGKKKATTAVASPPPPVSKRAAEKRKADDTEASQESKGKAARTRIRRSVSSVAANDETSGTRPYMRTRTSSSASGATKSARGWAHVPIAGADDDLSGADEEIAKLLDKRSQATVPTALEVAEVDPWDSFMRFNVGWVLPEGTKRSRVVPPPPKPAPTTVPAQSPAPAPVAAPGTSGRKAKDSKENTATVASKTDKSQEGSKPSQSSSASVQRRGQSGKFVKERARNGTASDRPSKTREERADRRHGPAGAGRSRKSRGEHHTVAGGDESASDLSSLTETAPSDSDLSQDDDNEAGPVDNDEDEKHQQHLAARRERYRRLRDAEAAKASQQRPARSRRGGDAETGGDLNTVPASQRRNAKRKKAAESDEEDDEDESDEDLHSSGRVKIPPSKAKRGAVKIPPRKRSATSLPEEGKPGDFTPGTLVWAKLASFPYYPSEVISPDSPLVPEGVLASHSNFEADLMAGNELHLVHFFDSQRTWAWVPTNKLRFLFEDDELDARMLKLKGKDAKPHQRAAIRQAYVLAKEALQESRSASALTSARTSVAREPADAPKEGLTEESASGPSESAIAAPASVSGEGLRRPAADELADGDETEEEVMARVDDGNG